jgi:lipopolysaccharide export system permease protein
MFLKILDRYILFKFLSTLFFIVLGLTAVICVIDFTEKNDDFIRTSPGWGKIFGDYFLNFFPYMVNMLSPITIFIATVWVTSRLAARTEIVAILSSGVSFIRLLVPYVIGATIVAGFIFILNAYILPPANRTRVAFEVEYTRDPFTFDRRNIHLKVAPDTYAYLESYNISTNTGYLFTLETIKDGRLITKTKADRVIWIPTASQWRMENTVERDFLGDGTADIRFRSRADTTLRITPADFANNYLHYETLTTPELNHHISELEARGADNINPYRIEKYLRLTYPFAIIILTVIGVILSARKSREGIGFQIALAFLLAFIYILFFTMSRSIAQAGSIPPLLACWLPNIVFSLIGVVLYRTVPR